MSELVGVTCDYDVHGRSCIAWAGHRGRHRTSIERKPQSAEAPADSLDAAWAEAEAALPEGWAIDGLYRVVARTSLEREWEVIVHEDDWQGDEDNHHGRGPTPAAALRALAARLRER